MPTKTGNSDIVQIFEMVIGIDVGGSTTKIVGIENGEICSPQFITAADPITSLFGAFGKYIYDNRIELSDVSQVMLTGVGSAYVEGSLYGLPTARTDEFMANALGARFRSGLERMIVVSMGTGTSFIKVDGDSIEYMGGLAIGGGTLQGLSRILFHSHDLRQVVAMASRGDATKVDLQIGDISRVEIPGLPSSVTASNLGKAEANAEPADVAAGIINMILQTIGSAANLVSYSTSIKDFVLIGNLPLLPQSRPLYDRIEALYGIRVHIPEYTEYRTAIGAALSFINGSGSR